MKDNFRIREASEILGISKSHLYKMIRNGTLIPKRRHPLLLSRKTLRNFIRSRVSCFDYLFPETL